MTFAPLDNLKILFLQSTFFYDKTKYIYFVFFLVRNPLVLRFKKVSRKFEKFSKYLAKKQDNSSRISRCSKSFNRRIGRVIYSISPTENSNYMERKLTTNTFNHCHKYVSESFSTCEPGSEFLNECYFLQKEIISERKKSCKISKNIVEKQSSISSKYEKRICKKTSPKLRPNNKSNSSRGEYYPNNFSLIPSCPVVDLTEDLNENFVDIDSIDNISLNEFFSINLSNISDDENVPMDENKNSSPAYVIELTSEPEPTNRFDNENIYLKDADTNLLSHPVVMYVIVTCRNIGF